jgi:hypothetical protein
MCVSNIFLLHLSDDSDQDDPADYSAATEDQEMSSETEDTSSTVIHLSENDGKRVIVQLPSINGDGRRMQKVHACVYCNGKYPKLPRHFEQKHSSEIEVARILNMQKGSSERKLALAVLSKKGDFHHNYSVLEKGCGVLIPKYRPRKGKEKPAEDYIPCQYCFGMYVKTELWRHQMKCTSSTSKADHRPVASGRLLLPSKGPELLHATVLVKMKNDEIKLQVQKDELILEFGSRLLEKLDSGQESQHLVSIKMRELARLVLAMKEEYGIKTLVQCLLPSNWNNLISGVQKVSKYDANTKHYDIPSLCLKLGHSLQKCAKILKTRAIMSSDVTQQQQAEAFLELYRCEWGERVSVKAHHTLNVKSFNRPKLLPLVSDVVCLHKHVEQELDKLESAMQTSPKEVYSDYAMLCLTQIILFNRKRSGEAQRMKVSEFENGLKVKNVDAQIKKCLSTFEVELCESHQRIEILGKCRKKVPVILTPKMLQNIRLLVKSRSALSIVGDFLFVRRNSVHTYRGSDVLRRFASECGAKCPELLTSTKLRKQIATLSQLLNLNETNQDMLATFLGHDIRIHREFYRLPEGMLQVAKVGKLLHAINSGKIGQYKDQDLDAMEIGDQGNQF